MREVFGIVNQKVRDFRHQHAKVHHFQHQAFEDKKNHNPSKQWAMAD